MARRVVVVKVGSSTLVDARGRPRRQRLAALAADITSTRDAGTPVCIVSSGAVALGLGVMQRASRPRRVADLQAAAAIGQGVLVRAWQHALDAHAARAAQVLLTAAEVRARASYIHARATLETLLRWGVVPIVNENDSTATEEITFGDNDALAAQVSILLRARLLVLLTDQDGLYTRDPRHTEAVLVSAVRDHTLLAQLDVDATTAGWGIGGMRSKVVAAEMASAGGVMTVIANGARPGVVSAAAAGKPVGTRFAADERAVSAFKLWIRYGRPAAGRIDVDAGARRALIEDGASLLPVGVTATHGRFGAGDTIELAAPDGTVFAKGVSELSAAQLERLAGVRGAECAVHRDQLVVLSQPAVRSGSSLDAILDH